MKLFLLVAVAALVASVSAAAVKPVDKPHTQASIDAAVEYFKAPEPRGNQLKAASAKRKREDAVAAAVEYFKAPTRNDHRARRAASIAVPPIVTYVSAKPNVPMATYTAAAKTAQERDQMQKDVAAWRQYRDELHDALFYCQTRQNVTAALSDQLMNLEVENVGRKEQCYVYCVVERLGDYNTAGVQMDRMRRSVGAFVGMERLDKVLDMCGAVKAGSVCESGYKFYECYRRNLFNMRNAEDKPTHTYVWLVRE